MPFSCKYGWGKHSEQITIQHRLEMYNVVKYCKVCAIYVEIENYRCNCCNAPLRCTSKRTSGVKK